MNQAIPWRRIAAEFAVIFVGITLSLAADDWRQGLDDEARELRLLGNIASDLEQDSVELFNLIEAMGRWDAASYWLNANGSRTDLPSDSVLFQLRRFGFVASYQPVSSAYLGVRDGGLIHLLRDDALRARIIDYFEVQQGLIQMFNSRTEDGWNRWFQITAGYLDWVPPEDTATMWVLHQNLRLTQPLSALLANPVINQHIDWAGLIGGNTVLLLAPVVQRNTDLRRDLMAYVAAGGAS